MLDARTFAQWRRRWVPGGVELVLRAAPTAGYIRILPHETPLRSVRAIVRGARDQLAQHARDVRLVEVASLVTLEGEYAAMLAFSAHAARGPMRRQIGAVFTDEFQAVVDAACELQHAAEFTTMTESLVRELPLSAGRQRRRVRFDAPDGWALRSRGLLTHAYAPSYPRDRTLLTVLPAQARGWTSLVGAFVYEDIVQGFTISEQEPERALECSSGLVGKLILVHGSADGVPRSIQAAVLEDAEYRYVVRLESASRHDPERILLPVARSLHPVPLVQRLQPEQVSPLAYFAE